MYLSKALVNSSILFLNPIFNILFEADSKHLISVCQVFELCNFSMNRFDQGQDFSVDFALKPVNPTQHVFAVSLVDAFKIFDEVESCDDFFTEMIQNVLLQIRIFSPALSEQ